MNKMIFFKQGRLALVSTLIAFLLAACGGGNSSSDNAESEAETPTAEESNNTPAAPVESRYKAIAGKWQVVFKEGEKLGEKDGFKFTINLDGTGLVQGKPMTVSYDPKTRRFNSDAAISFFGTVNSKGTRIDGFYGGLFGPSAFTGTKIQTFSN